MNNLTTEIKVQVLENGRITFTYFNLADQKLIFGASRFPELKMLLEVYEEI